MTKDEYVKKLKKYYDDHKLKETDSYGEGYTDGLAEALVYAIGLAGKLDEPKKVVIPQFVADWIEKSKVYYGDEIDPMIIAYWIGNHVGSSESHYEWMKNIYNQKLLLNAIANGYEVEKEKKYRVKIKGIGLEEEEWLNCKVVGDIRYFELNSSTENEVYKTNFTKQWLKDNWSEYDAYNNAGLLEFEEVEDD